MLKKIIMKRLIIKNLKDCFMQKITFAELAEFEKRVFKSNDVLKLIEIGQNALRFKYAKIDEDLCIVMYYEYTYLPF